MTRTAAGYSTAMGGSVQRAVPTSGDNIAVVASRAGNIFVIVKPAGLLATLTFTLPPGDFDAQTITIAVTQPITSLVFNGAPLVGALTSVLANGFSRYVWSAADGTWYRCG